ncbi:UDP-Glycosyltransferase superfamily protein [Euphorbia peplus]|nr:UDP-Glycosyltransferase superfamily protein [Euphorbia peplus]
MESSCGSHTNYHALIFPFMAKGHTIPLLHLSHLLVRRGISVTLFTTQANRSFIVNILSKLETNANIIDLPFPQNVPEIHIPAGVESTDKLPSMSLFPQFALATALMQQDFEKELQKLPRCATFLISDSFLWWTAESAKNFGIPSFYELEPLFVDHLSKTWCAGPFCLVKTPKCSENQKPSWIKWLDEKLIEGRPVLYVAFGSQAEISDDQLKEIATGLEESMEFQF